LIRIQILFWTKLRQNGMNVIREKLWLANAWTKKNNRCYIPVLEPDPDQGKKQYSVVDPDLYGTFWGLLDPDPLVRGTDPDSDPSIIKQK